MKKIIIALALLLFPLAASANFFDWFYSPTKSVTLGVVDLKVFTPAQGGTGIGSTSAGNVGNCLKVLTNSPFAYTIGSCAAGSSWATSSQDYYNSQFRDWSLQGTLPYLAPTTSRAVIINSASSTITNLISINSTSTNLTAAEKFYFGTGGQMYDDGSTNRLFASDPTRGLTIYGNNSTITINPSGGHTRLEGGSDIYVAATNLSTGLLKLDGSNLLTNAVTDSDYLYPGTAASTYVPYSGASGAIDLGSQNLTTSGALTLSSLSDGCLTSSTGLIGSSPCVTDTNTDKWATSSDSVSIQPNAGQGILVSASSTVTNLTSNNSTSTNATSTNLSVSSSLTATDRTTGFYGVVGVVRYITLPTSTSTTWTATTSGDRVPFVTMPFSGTLKDVSCNATSSGAFIGVAPFIGTLGTLPAYFVASGTPGTIPFTGNNTFTKGQVLGANFGTTTTDNNAKAVSCTFRAVETP